MSHWLDKYIALQYAQLGEYATNLIADAAVADEAIPDYELEEFAAAQRRSQAAEAES